MTRLDHDERQARDMFTRLGDRLRYWRYRRAQVRQSRAKRAKDASFRLVPFVDLIRRACPDLAPAAPVLSIGARNEIELDVLARAGFTNVTAIDLWSTSPRIRVGDMHGLTFDSGAFALIFASHVFEHAWDFSRVAAECVRVLRPGGYLFCAVPIGFEPSEHDRYDFKDANGLLTYFAPWRLSLIAERHFRPGELSLLMRREANPSGTA
jgi:SAM-dependent methyltransferase